MKKSIKITIPDNLSKEEEGAAIYSKLSGKLIENNKKAIGDFSVQELTTSLTITVERKNMSKEKIIEMVKCPCCENNYQNDMFLPVFINYGGNKKKIKVCSSSCQKDIIDVCGEGRAAKTSRGVKPVRTF